MHHHAKLLEKIGRTREIAQAIGIADPYISKWKRGGIPNKYASAVIKLARAKKIKPTLSDFFEDV